MTQQLASKRRCPRCGKKVILTDSTTGEMFCGVCGFVILDRIMKLVNSLPKVLTSLFTTRICKGIKLI